MRARKPRSAFALLEVLVALALVAITGGAAVSLARESLRVARQVQDSEAQLRRANAFLNAAALWPRADLDRRLGTRRQGPWRLYIEREDSVLYRVQLTDSTNGRLLLETTLYREQFSVSDADPR